MSYAWKDFSVCMRNGHLILQGGEGGVVNTSKFINQQIYQNTPECAGEGTGSDVSYRKVTQ